MSWYRSYSFTAYEFSASEEQFLNWVNDQGVDRRALLPASESVPLRVSRFNRRETSESQTATITDGLFWEYRQSNGGGRVLAFDRATGRAYYQSNPR